MGKYINTINGSVLSAQNKAGSIINHLPEAKVVLNPVFQPNLVCVVQNAFFDAAAYCYDEGEFQAFNYPDGREKTWLIVPDAEKYID